MPLRRLRSVLSRIAVLCWRRGRPRRGRMRDGLDLRDVPVLQRLHPVGVHLVNLLLLHHVLARRRLLLLQLLVL